MEHKYQNQELVKLAAGLKATQCDKIKKIMMDFGEKVKDGDLRFTKEPPTALKEDSLPKNEDLEIVCRNIANISAEAQNRQDRMIIGSHMFIFGGKFRDMREAYREMERTGVYEEIEIQGTKLDLEPEYTILESLQKISPKP